MRSACVVSLLDHDSTRQTMSGFATTSESSMAACRLLPLTVTAPDIPGDDPQGRLNNGPVRSVLIKTHSGSVRLAGLDRCT